MNDMRAPKGKSLLIAGGAVALMATVAIAALIIFDINKFKANIEAAAFVATGLEVGIRGKMGLSFFPFGVSAQDIHVTNQGNEILSIENLKLGAKLMPLLKKQLEITSCELVRPVVTIVKEADGKYNFESIAKKSTERQPGALFSLNNLKLSKGVLVYLDRKSRENSNLKDFNLSIKNLSVVDTSGDIIKNISFTGNLDCKEGRRKGFEFSNFKSFVQAEKGVFHFKPFTMDIYGSTGEGDATVDRSQVDALYTIKLKASKLDFEKFEQAYGIKKVIGGKGDFVAALTIKEKGNRTLPGSTSGTLSLRGDNLVVNTMDLDKLLSSYESSQEFNLIDLGAFFIAGPLGNVALKGYHYGDFFNQARGGQGTITQFISHWTIKDGVAEAIDCAFATPHNRVAFKGQLDFVRERYDNVTVALLDDIGCAKFKQSISGSFSKPQISAVNVYESLTGPFSNLYRKAQRFVQGGKCEVFYRGAVRQAPR